MQLKYSLNCFVKLIYPNEEDYGWGEIIMVIVLVIAAVFVASISL